MPGSVNPESRDRRSKRIYRHHDRIPPKYAKSYDTIISIRNPYDRLASLYAMAHRRKMLHIPHRTFEEMVDFLIKSLDSRYDNDYVRLRCLPIHKYIEPIENLKYIIKLENLINDLNKLPYYKEVTKLPRKNVQPAYKSFNELSTPRILEKVNFWAGPDFELYNYAKRT
jgi:hypothetical protein